MSTTLFLKMHHLNECFSYQYVAGNKQKQLP